MTSNVDPVNESLIQDAITELAKNRTVLVVAHHLKPFKKAAKFSYFKKATYLKKEGIRNFLINGCYTKLWKAQYENCNHDFVKDVSYEWEDGRTALKNINLEIKKVNLF